GEIESPRAHLLPEARREQSAKVVVFHDDFGAPALGAHPRIHQSDALHPRVPKRIEEDPAGRFALPEENNLLDRGHLQCQRGDCSLNICVGMLESTVLTAAIPHATQVKPQHGVAEIGQLACQRYELAMRASAILGSTSNYN